MTWYVIKKFHLFFYHFSFENPFIHDFRPKKNKKLVLMWKQTSQYLPIQKRNEINGERSSISPRYRQQNRRHENRSLQADGHDVAINQSKDLFIFLLAYLIFQITQYSFRDPSKQGTWNRPHNFFCSFLFSALVSVFFSHLNYFVPF